ncbi:MAG: TolC family protein [Bacteroidales bacterium]|nr:TolC family protein [Bacteroidales bacterium]
MIHFLQKTGLLVLMTLASFPLFAQVHPSRVSFSLAEAQQYAVEHNRTLANASIDIQKAQASRWQTIASMLPQVSASASYSNMMGYKMDLGAMQLSMPPYATFNVQTAVGLSGAQIVSLGIADISRKMADITLEKSEKEIANQVETLYFSALVTEETIRLLEENLESMRKLHAMTQTSVDVGVAEQTDADQLQVQVATMESTIKSTQRSLEMIYNSLRLQLCLDDDVDIVLTQGIDDLLNLGTTSDLLAAEFDINDNYDYKLLKESTELARKQIALTGWSNGPSFSVYHQYNGRHNFSDEPTMNMTPPNMLGAQLNIPIFTFGKTYAAIKDARLSYKKQLNTLEDTELALNVQYRQLLYNLRSAIEKYEIQKQNVAVARRVFGNIARKYEFGVASSLDVTNSGTNLISAQSSYIQSLLEIINAQVSLEQLLNK